MGIGFFNITKPEGHKSDRQAIEPALKPVNAGKSGIVQSDNPDPAKADKTPAEQTKTKAEKPKKSRGTARFGQLLFSSLTRRIVVLNLSALVVLLSGILYLNQFRQGLVEAHLDSLEIQGKIIAAAIASSATVETNAITVDPDKLLELEAGQAVRPRINSLDDLGSPIDAEAVAPLIRRLIQTNRTRARIYDHDGILILDTRFLYSGGQVLRYDLPPVSSDENGFWGKISRYWSSRKLGQFLNRILGQRDLPPYVEYPHTGMNYPEVVSALMGSPSTFVRSQQTGGQIISVAVPIQKLRFVSGALLLSSQGDQIDRIVAEERLAILRIFLIAGIVIIVLSIILSGTIANPLRKLSDAANQVRSGVDRKVEIPDFSARHDEIGTLSTSLRSMTGALYSRIEAIERFAADVAHELKNPLTSLASAVETLPLAKSEKSKQELHEVIKHDIKRLDRLITDISDASRLDAELARDKTGPVDFSQIIQNVVSMFAGDEKTNISYNVEIIADGQLKPANTGNAAGQFILQGREERLARVIINLLENARSFVDPKTGQINLTLTRKQKQLRLNVQDNGPGIPSDNVDRIFERFYTDRPESQGFGQNSGLGLSICRQIIEAHGGTIKAENRTRHKGARFVIKLPIDQH